MSRMLCLVLLGLALFPTSILARSSSRSHAATHPRRSERSKPVHVHGYTRKNGTYVAPYRRSRPGTAPHSQESHHGGHRH